MAVVHVQAVSLSPNGQQLQALDTSLFFRINNGLANPVFDQVMPLLSALGDDDNPDNIWVQVATGLTRAGEPAAGACMLLAMQVAKAAKSALKDAIQRERPPFVLSPVRLLLPVKKDFSFPSGHTTVAFAAVAAASRFNPILALRLLPLANAIGFSRVYVGHHFPTDVLGGAVLGWAVGRQIPCPGQRIGE